MKGFTLQELATLTGATLIGNPTHIICGAADIEHATSTHITFLSNKRYEKFLQESEAGCIVIDTPPTATSHKNFLVSPNPSLTFQTIINALSKELTLPCLPPKTIHETAIIHKEATIEENVAIGPYAVIERGACIGKDTIISANCYIGAFTTVGENCLLWPHVTVRERCLIKNRVILHPHVVIGSCGFGYMQDGKGHHIKLDQIGTVTLDDDVEIGAGSTVDRARFQVTHIGEGTKIDNLVLIAHGVKIGKHCIIVGQTGIAGSTEIGDHVIIGGQCAIDGHIKIASQTMVAACSAVSKSMGPGKFSGVPAIDIRESHKMRVHLRNLDKYVDIIKELQKNQAPKRSPKRSLWGFIRSLLR